MAAPVKTFKTIDGYISMFPKKTQAILQKLRKAIKEAAPKAEEAISYQMPTFRLDKKNMVHFAAWKTHIGFYPTPSGTETFKEELSRYKTSKGAVQFPIDQPIPIDLVKSIVRFRAGEIQAKV